MSQGGLQQKVVSVASLTPSSLSASPLKPLHSVAAKTVTLIYRNISICDVTVLRASGPANLAVAVSFIFYVARAQHLPKAKPQDTEP